MNKPNLVIKPPQLTIGTGSKTKPRRSLADVLEPKGRFVIALDATASMTSLIDMARCSIANILSRISEESGCQIDIEVMVYRDYDVEEFKLLERSGLHSKAEVLSDWLDKQSVCGGGANHGEAVEQAIQIAIHHDDLTAILLAGDEPAHSYKNLKQLGKSDQLTAEDLAKDCGKRNIPIHTFVVGDDMNTVRNFRAIATASGGVSGKLDGSNTMINKAVMAMLSALKGSTAVRHYVDKQQLEFTSSDWNFAEKILTLSGPSANSKK